LAPIWPMFGHINVLTYLICWWEMSSACPHILRWTHGYNTSYKIILSYSQWMVSQCFPIKWRYTNIEPVLNSIPIKLHRVFLSHNVVTVSSHYLIFHQHMYARQLSNRSILHAGRYLNDKEICYLGTVIVTANVCRGRL